MTLGIQSRLANGANCYHDFARSCCIRRRAQTSLTKCQASAQTGLNIGRSDVPLCRRQVLVCLGGFFVPMWEDTLLQLCYIGLSAQTWLDLQVLQTGAAALVQCSLLQSTDVHAASAALSQNSTDSRANQTASQYDSYACKPAHFSNAA